MSDTITGFPHLDIIADEIGDEAGTCDADYAFQRAAARMIHDLRNALESAEARAKQTEAEKARLRAERDWLARELWDFYPQKNIAELTAAARRAVAGEVRE